MQQYSEALATKDTSSIKSIGHEEWPLLDIRVVSCTVMLHLVLATPYIVIKSITMHLF